MEWAGKAQLMSALLVSALLLSGCGGGGGGGTSNVRPDSDGSSGSSLEPSTGRVPASTDGSGVVVAVLDSGVLASHDEFDNGERVLPGTNVADGNSDVTDMDSASHGTRVASVALGSTVGVAPGATLLPVRIIKSDGTFTTSEIAAGIDYARSQRVPVNNISATMYDTISIRNALEASASAGLLTVVAAGNRGSAEPIPAPLLSNLSAEAAAHFLIVGAVDGDDQITSWSDRAGSAMNRYLVALGRSVRSAVNTGDDQYGTASGTSFSSPQVAGAAALVKGADPALSMRDVADILLRTADDLGEPGVDAVYGWGKLNPSRALEPVGVLAIPDTEHAGGSAEPVSATSLRLGRAFGDALGNAPSLAGVIALDDYRRPYVVDARAAVLADHASMDLANRIAASTRDTEQVAAEWAGIRLNGMWQYKNTSWSFDDPFREDEPEILDGAMALSGQAANLGWEFTSGVAPGSRFGGGAFQEVSQLPWLSADSPADGHLSLVHQGSQGLAFAAAPFAGLDFNVGFFRGRNEFAPEDLSVRAGVAEAGFHTGNLQLRVTASQIHEEGGILSSVGGGALTTGQRALTNSLGLSGRWRLASRTSLVADYQLGRTRVNTSEAGLLRDWTTLDSDAWSIGAVRQGIFQGNDSLGIAYRRPLRVNSGSVVVDAPSHRDLSYGIVRTQSRVGLAPSGEEQNLELAYAYALDHGGQFSAALIYRIEPGHVWDADPEVAAVMGIRRRF